MLRTFFPAIVLAATVLQAICNDLLGIEADLILHGGKVGTVDKAFSIQEAIAVQGKNVLKVGSSEEILKLRGDKTEVLNLEGQMVIPGFIDSHTHPTGASMTEFDHALPEMESIADVLPI